MDYTPLLYVLIPSAIILFVLYLYILFPRKKPRPRSRFDRRCGACGKSLLYDESSICGPCAADETHFGEDAHWSDEIVRPMPTPPSPDPEEYERLKLALYNLYPPFAEMLPPLPGISQGEYDARRQRQQLLDEGKAMPVSFQGPKEIGIGGAARSQLGLCLPAVDHLDECMGLYKDLPDSQGQQHFSEIPFDSQNFHGLGPQDQCAGRGQGDAPEDGDPHYNPNLFRELP